MTDRVSILDIFKRYENVAGAPPRWVDDSVKLPCGHVVPVWSPAVIGLPYPQCVVCLKDFEDDVPWSVE
jgi:hypothetical protein